MQSAFGVEHGDEIAKFEMPTGLLKPVKALGSKIGGGTSRLGASMAPGTGTRIAGARRAPSLTNKIGSGLQRAGGAMAANPGKTGGIAIGGTGAIGAGAGMHQRKKQF